MGLPISSRNFHITVGAYPSKGISLENDPRYVAADGRPAGYPWNPNGSAANIAEICNAGGTILGLMPHPEDHLIPRQHPQFQRGQKGMLGLPLFENGIRYAANL
jgi:phosphoribosylformylglycinamidine (FGAM) synthase-like amidotransferase family enzyme